MLFPTSVVGSMPRPDFVRDLISDDFRVSESDYRARMEAAVRYVVALQKTPAWTSSPTASGGGKVISE